MTESLADFHFLRPWWLAVLVPLAILLWRLVHHRLRGGRWEAVCDSRLLPFVLMPGVAQRKRWPLYALTLGGSLCVLALAGPVWERFPQPVFRTQSALVIVLDLSRSMDAADVKPSRLARARFKVADILERRKEGQTALVVYARDAYAVTPLTDDTATIASQLPALTTDLMPVQGSRVNSGIELAAKLMEQAGNSKGDVLLITDGVELANATVSARALREAGYHLSVLGIGTEEGAPIPKPDGGFLIDRGGAIVLPKLNTQALRELAITGGGAYARLSANDSDLETLLSQPQGLGEVGDAVGLEADVWREQGPWLLLLLLPIAALAFRRGILGLLLLIAMPLPEGAQAFELSSLWLRADQQASRALGNGDAQGAAALFRDPAWKGAAHYRAEDYEAAVSALQGRGDATSHYNRGNALARLGSYQDAITAYDKVLEQDSNHEDARFNRDLLKELLDQEQQQQRQQQQASQDQEGPSPQDPSQGNSSGEDGHNQNESAPQGDREHRAQQQPTDGDQSQADREQDPGPLEQLAQDAAADHESEPTAGELSATDEDPQDSRIEQEESAAEEKQEAPQASAGELTTIESEQAAEQWLRRIPDDPGRLLRNKFRHLYGQRKPNDQEEADEQEW